MAQLVLKSKAQIISDQIAIIKARLGLNDFNPASNLATFVEAAATSDFELYVRLLQAVRNYNLDTTTGSDLDLRAFEYGLERRQAFKASGLINILRPVGFEKVSTGIYAGLPAPIEDDVTLNVNDASNALIGTSGTLIIGRGTQNVEEVTYSAAPTNNVNYWTFALDSALTKNHGLDESVILKQGNDELIIAGTVIRVPAQGTSPEIAFTVDQDATLLSGEDQVINVEVTAQEPGTRSNIPINMISGETAFTSPPFAGARARNPAKFTTGRDRETDQALRDRIKNHIQSLSRGVETAIKNAIVGLVDPNTAKRVVSANVILPVRVEDIVEIYIDDGTGFEPSFSFQGFEEVISQASGGETRIQLDTIPLVKAQIESSIGEPYNFSGGPRTLTYNVGTGSETITFFPTDFPFPGTVTAEQVVRAINNKATLIEARTSQQGFKVVIAAIADENEDIQVTGGTANSVMGFPTDLRQTLYLYKNDVQLSKDGTTAFVDSGNQETYDFSSLASPWELNLVIDNKTANPQLVTFQASDFALPNQATADEVVDVINSQLVGAEAILVSNGTAVRIISNTKLSAKSQIEITGGNVNTLLDFSTTPVIGRDGDYTFNRFTGTAEFVTPLAPNDKITAGSRFTRAFIRSSSPENYTITSGDTLLISIDGSPDQTITFPNNGVFTAQQVADFINAQLIGGEALAVEIASQDYLLITTSTQAESVGSIRIDSASTAAAVLSLETDTTKVNQRPHAAFVTSGTTGPWQFVENDNLIVVLDNDPQTKTFNIRLDFDGAVTTANSTTNFSASAFTQVFENADELEDFYLIMKSGDNTTTGDVASVVNQGGNTWRYSFSALPANLADYAAGDAISFSGSSIVANNGEYLITGISVGGNGYVDVTNPGAATELAVSFSALISQRRQITAYNEATGNITLGAALSDAPQVTDLFTILPSTVENLVDYINNIKVTTYGTKGLLEAAEGNTKIQFSSQLDGSNGYVQVTGGSGNELLQFNTAQVRGLEGYSFYTGLLALVHKTIYGDDRDRVAFPGIGAAGIHFDIQAPTVEEISITLDVDLAPGVSISQVEDEVKSAVSGYINGLGVGEDVIVERIRAAVIALNSITDVAVTNISQQKIPIAEQEVARTRDSLIVIG